MYVLRSEVCCNFTGAFCNVLGSFSGPYEGHFGRCVGPSGSFAAKRAICIIWCNLRCFPWFYEPMYAYVCFFRSVFAALGVGVFPIAVLCGFWLPRGSILEPFVAKLSVHFLCVFWLRFFEAPGGLKKGTSASDPVPAWVNWGGLAPPPLVS